MKIALIGSGGQLGNALQSRLTGEIVCLTSSTLDISDEERVRTAIPGLKPNLVINAAAYNFVDKAEDEPERALSVNGFGPRNLARVCRELEIPFVHVSTDYVFGAPSIGHVPRTTTEQPTPTSQYARSKLAGEEFVVAETPMHFIIRTCGLYGKASSPGKGNFVETMLKKGPDLGSLRVVDDQWCTPTSTADLAQAIVDLIPTQKYGLYHATNSGSTTWFRFAREIFRQAKLRVEVVPITTADFKAKAPRPSFSVLDCSKLTSAIGRPIRPWPEALAEYLTTR